VRHPCGCIRIGSLEEIISDGETGLHFEVGDPKNLAMKVNILLSNHELAENWETGHGKFSCRSIPPNRIQDAHGHIRKGKGRFPPSQQVENALFCLMNIAGYSVIGSAPRA
jgi:hypothetical protein